MKLFFEKNVQKFCVSFIEQNVGEVKVDKDATDCDEDGSKDVVLTNEEKEEKQEKEEKEERQEKEKEEKEQEKEEKKKEEEVGYKN